jgi:lipid II isoglutaminyl synthase (glutamine-hydrolysing)
MACLRIGYLYPSVMCQYGDRGNLIALQRRCAWRGIEVEVRNLDLGAGFDPDEIDLLLMGGGADSHERLIAEDLVEVKGEAMRRAIEDGAPAFVICGGYQLLGESYVTYDRNELRGLGVFAAYTVHRAAQIGAHLTNIENAGEVRAVGNLVVQWGEHTLIGFENHGGRTYLREGAEPLGRVLTGGGNNSEDGLEGCVYKNAIGTYMHSVLPKNPVLADWLIESAIRRRQPGQELAPLDDALENRAHDAVEQLVLDGAGRRR